MKISLRSLSLAAVLLPMSITANAALLLGHDRNQVLFLIDTSTQTVIEVGDTGIPDRSPELQLTPDGKTLWVHDVNGSIWSVNPITAFNYGSTVVSFPDTPNDNERTATALEYVGNSLYAAFENPGPETGPGFLGTLDPATGATTGIGVLTGMDAPAGGFAYWDDTMYAVSSADSRYSQLYTINLATGEATLVADITLGGEQVEAMTALEIVDGVAYTKSNDTYDQTGGIDVETLYSLDLVSGELTALFDMGVSVVGLTRGDAVASSAPVPSASQWAVISLALLLVAFGAKRLGRRRAG